ncbi:MAG TPA: TlpA disulfide reductase family protein [Ilumatobacteraceae bacterium]|nr:TlpA disulfide reductase family protein [Ilumatobacteraceae bacterium]
MKIRPRLLVGSLLVAVAVIVTFVWTQRADDDADTDVDATLQDPQAVVTYPNDGLGNDDVQGDPFPEVVLVDRDDNEITTADLIGEPLVVNLWYSTCAPCAKELPDFAEVDAETDDARFVGVNTLDSVEVMERFAGERGVEYDLFRDEFAELADAIGATAMPITLFVTSDGTIVEQTGPLDADELRTKIADLLAADEGAA